MWTPSDTLLARYLANECDAAEARQIEHWADETPANRVRLDEFRAIWQAPPAPVSWDIEGMWAGVRRTMRTERARSRRFGRAFHAERRRWWTSPIAAAAAVVLTAGASLLVLRTSHETPVAPATVSMREYATPRGQRATFQLPDGTHLMLSAESRLRVPVDYGSREREVYLDGEALFEVVHDSTRPFRVRARDAVVEDIGTRFDVRAYAEDPAVAVAVAEGIVALGRASVRDTAAGSRREAQGILLRKGELGTLATDGRVTTATGDVVASYLAWAEGRLRFVEAPLPEVVRAIGRWYDLDLRVEGKALAARRVTAEFPVQSADELLRALSLALDARVVRSGKVVRIQPRS